MLSFSMMGCCVLCLNFLLRLSAGGSYERSFNRCSSEQIMPVVCAVTRQQPTVFCEPNFSLALDPPLLTPALQTVISYAHCCDFLVASSAFLSFCSVHLQFDWLCTTVPDTNWSHHPRIWHFLQGGSHRPHCGRCVEFVSSIDSSCRLATCDRRLLITCYRWYFFCNSILCFFRFDQLSGGSCVHAVSFHAK